MFWRLHAQRLLVERGKTDVAADLLEARRRTRRVDAIGLNPAAIHALWTLQRPRRARRPASRARRRADGGFDASVGRRAAERGAGVPADDWSPARCSAWRELLDDPEPQVRLAALLALAEMPTPARRARRRRHRPSRRGGRRRPLAGRRGDRRRGGHDASSSSKLSRPASSTRPPSPDALADRRRASPSTTPAAAPADAVGAILAPLAKADPTRPRRDRRRVRQGLAEGQAARRSTTTPRRRSPRSCRSSRPTSRGQMLGLASRWGVKGLDELRRRAREGPPRRRPPTSEAPTPPASTPPGSSSTSARPTRRPRAT